jgi:hypothetical protein
MEVTKWLKPPNSGHDLVTPGVCKPQREFPGAINARGRESDGRGRADGLPRDGDAGLQKGGRRSASERFKAHPSNLGLPVARATISDEVPRE